MAGHELAKEYERRYPGTGVPEAQAIERMDRIRSKEARQQGRRSRFITVPELPWHKEHT